MKITVRTCILNFGKPCLSIPRMFPVNRVTSFLQSTVYVNKKRAMLMKYVILYNLNQLLLSLIKVK